MEFGKWILTPLRPTCFPLSIQVGPVHEHWHPMYVIRKGPTWHLSERARSKKVGSLLTREESRYVKGEGALRGREETYSPRIPRELRSLTPTCAHHRRKFSERAQQNHQQHPSFWFPEWISITCNHLESSRANKVAHMWPTSKPDMVCALRYPLGSD